MYQYFFFFLFPSLQDVILKCYHILFIPNSCHASTTSDILPFFPPSLSLSLSLWYYSAVLLVVDKERLECLKSQQPVLVQTVKDLKAAQMHAQVSVPLIVIVNKVRERGRRRDTEQGVRYCCVTVCHCTSHDAVLHLYVVLCSTVNLPNLTTKLTDRTNQCNVM